MSPVKSHTPGLLSHGEIADNRAITHLQLGDRVAAVIRHPHVFPIKGQIFGGGPFGVGADDRACLVYLHEPNEILNYVNLGALYLNLNRLDDAKAVFDQAMARKLDGGPLRWMMYYLAFLRRDSTQLEQQLTWAAGKPGDEDALLSFQSDTEAYYRGILRTAEQGTDLLAQSRGLSATLRLQGGSGSVASECCAARGGVRPGRGGEARRYGRFGTGQGRDVSVLAALALARVGETARAKRLVEELAKSYPSNTMLKLYWLPTINAVEIKDAG